LFAPIGQPWMNVGGELVVARDRLGAARDQVRTFGNQLLIPHGKFGRVVSALAKIAQQTIALFHHLVVFRECASIARINLRESRVEVTAAVAGRAEHQVEILGQEQYRIQFAQQVERALADAIDLDALGDAGT